MKNNSPYALMLIPLLALFLISADLISAPSNTTDFKFAIGSGYGERKKFTIPTFSEGGCLLAQIKPWPWSPSGTSKSRASQLALILNGSDQTEYYARADVKDSSVSPLWISFTVPSTKVTNKVTWTISVVNFSRSGTAEGTISLDYPPTQIPCELKAAVSKTSGKVYLSWRYIGKSFKGFFLVERSTNGKDWNKVVSGCKKASPTTASTTTPIDFSCSDTGLTSGSTYYYRACVVTYTTATPSVLNCTKAKYTTPSVSARAP